jgi:ATP-dependent protease ClpP protease subunit
MLFSIIGPGVSAAMSCLRCTVIVRTEIPTCFAQLVPAVTELVISELLWLNYNNPEKQIYVYLNSIGSQTPDGQAVGFETEAYAILDTLGYIRPDVYTLVIGQAFGNAAMIASCGKKVVTIAHDPPGCCRSQMSELCHLPRLLTAPDCSCP